MDAPLSFKRHVCKRYRPPIPPQGVLRNASTFASADRTRQKVRTMAESAGKCFQTFKLSLPNDVLDALSII